MLKAAFALPSSSSSRGPADAARRAASRAGRHVYQSTILRRIPGRARCPAGTSVFSVGAEGTVSGSVWLIAGDTLPKIDPGGVDPVLARLTHE